MIPPGPTPEPGLLPEWRLRLYPRILLGTLGIVFFATVLTSSGPASLAGRLGGDFPAFYGAGLALARGQAEQLYDRDVQTAIQQDLFPEAETRLLPFAYPPFVALAYWPFSLLPYRLAYTLHTLLLCAALFLAIQLLRPVLPVVDRYAFGAFAMAVGFYPVFRGLTGAQNTAITILLMAVVWRTLHDGQGIRAGIALGLMLFKPQLALPLIGLISLTRRLDFWISLVPVAGLLYLLGVAVGGWTWPAAWWQQASAFHGLDRVLNAQNSVGLLGVCEALLGAGRPLALAAGGLLSGLVALGAMILWWHADRYPLDLRMGATAAALVLISPHSMYYDAGLLVLTFAALAHRRGRDGIPMLGGLWLAGATALAAPMIGVNPVFFVVLAAGAWCLAVMPGLSPQSPAGPAPS